MRASADRPLSALVAILATILVFGLLVFFLDRASADKGLSAQADSSSTATPSE